MSSPPPAPLRLRRVALAVITVAFRILRWAAGARIAILLSTVSVAGFAQAQSLPAPATTAATVTEDPYGRGSPRGLATGLIAALAARDFGRASRYFDLSSVRPSQRDGLGARHARRLQAALDGGGSLLAFNRLSTDPAGRLDDQLPPDEERIGELPGSRGPVALLAVGRAGGDGARVWTIAAASLPAIAASAEIAAAGGPDRVRQLLPRFLTDAYVAGAPLCSFPRWPGVSPCGSPTARTR